MGRAGGISVLASVRPPTAPLTAFCNPASGLNGISVLCVLPARRL